MLTLTRLDETNSTPLYRQLFEQIAEAIRSGAVGEGDRLPPTRELAGQLGLNRTTVSAAYDLLEAEGLIDGQVGRGSFVRAVPAAPSHLVSFCSSRPAEEEFPIAEFQAACDEVTRGARVLEILQLGSPAGYGPLREYLRAGLPPGDDVLITSGCQQALDLIQRVLAPAGETVAIEDPVYPGVRNVFLRGGARVAGIATGPDGADPDALARVMRQQRPRLAVLTPNFQNPTGATMPLDARRRVLQLGVPVVENDIYGDLRYAGHPVPRFKEIDPEAGVILIRSFSKVAFPGLRVGWIAAPKAIIAKLSEAKQWSDLHSDQLSQAILLRFAESGRLSAHIDRVRAAGLARLRAVLRACDAHMPEGARWTRPEGGMSLWVRLPEPLDADRLLPRAERAGVSYLPGSNFAVTQPETGSLRLSFGSLTPRAIESGVAALGRVFAAGLEHTNSRDRFEAAAALV